MKNQLIVIIGAIGAAISSALGGWDTSVINLVIVMAIDYVTGLIVAGIFKKSNKTASGGLSSAVGWKGLIKKCMTMVVVVIANILDKQIGTTYIRDAVCIAFIANEALSIVENSATMGVPIPKVILNAIDLLKRRSDDSDPEREGKEENDNNNVEHQ